MLLRRVDGWTMIPELVHACQRPLHSGPGHAKIPGSAHTLVRMEMALAHDLNPLPKNIPADGYSDRETMLRAAACYEMERLAQTSRHSVKRANGVDLPDTDAFTLPIADGVSLGFRRIDPGTYIDGFTEEMKTAILSIKNRANDVERWEALMETDRHDRVTVPYGFFMSETFVTNRMFDCFVASTRYRTSVDRYKTGWFVDRHAQWRQGIANDYHLQPGPLSDPDHPVTLISWFDAMSFSLWLGGKTGTHIRVPTREEWLLAAVPGSMSDEVCVFPWGNKIDGIEKRMNFASRELSEYAWVYDQFADGYAYTSPVDAYPPTERGLYDMTGNVWTWNFSSMTQYESRPRGEREAHVPRLHDLGAGANEVLTMQGGCYLARLTHANLFSKMGHPALDGACDIGFRLVVVDRARFGW